jgi:hypothetical protein
MDPVPVQFVHQLLGCATNGNLQHRPITTDAKMPEASQAVEGFCACIGDGIAQSAQRDHIARKANTHPASTTSKAVANRSAYAWDINCDRISAMRAPFLWSTDGSYCLPLMSAGGSKGAQDYVTARQNGPRAPVAPTCCVSL